MSCTVKERTRVRKAATALRDCDHTISVDVINPASSQYDRWTLDAVLQTQEGVPPTILRELARAGLTLQPTPSRATVEHVAATV